MKTTCLTLLAILTLASPALAEGDAAEGAAEFKKCKSCHSIVADDGTEIQKGGKTGPNLYGVIGRAVGSTDFAYGDSLPAIGQAGKVWDEASVAAFITDPAAWVKQALGDDAAKTKMTFKLKDDQDDMAAYLASVVK